MEGELVSGKKSKKKEKQSRRSKSKYGALDPKFAPKVRKEYLDFDYLDQLSEEEKTWLNKFVDEELHASFKNDKRDLNKTKDDKKRAYSNNNSRNRDLYSIAKVSNLVTKLEDLAENEITDIDQTRSDIKTNHSENYNLEEDAMIARLDKKKK
jgi:hypothetical protein